MITAAAAFSETSLTLPGDIELDDDFIVTSERLLDLRVKTSIGRYRGLLRTILGMLTLAAAMASVASAPGSPNRTPAGAPVAAPPGGPGPGAQR